MNPTGPSDSYLDNLTFARKEGWRNFVERTALTSPETLTKRQIRNLSEEATKEYRRQRSIWHNNMGPFQTPQLKALHEALEVAVEANLTKYDYETKEPVAISGLPTEGKSVAVQEFCRKFHQAEVLRCGEFTRNGDERWPVLRIGMRGNTGMKTFHEAMCYFYAHPARLHGNVDQLGRHALDLITRCETRILIVDNFHFLHWQRDGGTEIINHCKYLADNFPVTIITIGIGLDERGILMAGTPQANLAQMAHCTTILGMPSFEIRSPAGRRDWCDLLASIERHVVLGAMRDGMILDLAAYLHFRTDGHIGSLTTLIRRACAKAIISGKESITKSLFESIKIDTASEKAKGELERAYRTRNRVA
ncbi:AAA family ATPase [Mycolicibacterium porcinum]|uniref:TniB family NTP-binding protein n=1 Tax=Mycolicibacterium porcinum TaxID=39693 RepID=UPI0011932B43|nr:TniB family NTP-binding protein [Mycolicibacterium porcinum]TVX96016.1 AAA family ATPase [Mycolicibacterium porcinum]